ncbi:MAG: mannitol dehydrogenase family protein [Luteimonas sp.]
MNLPRNDPRPVRLSNATVASLPAPVARPRYDRSAVKIGVVHLGIGAFHRAHQAVMFDDLLNCGDLRWGVLGASLRTPDVRDRLMPQDGLYTLVDRDGSDQRMRVIGAVQEVLVGPEHPQRLIAAMATPDVHLVTLTVTEKGYKLDPSSGVLLFDDPEVAADLADPTQPRTAPAFIVAALARRRALGLLPFTVMSCDNLSGNGQRVRSAVIAFAKAIDPSLSEWIAEAGAFPNTMVDRIVPATTQADIAHLAERLGVEDRGTVNTEPFSQWIIEEHFAGPRPDFDAVGARVTNDAQVWEAAKLRLLNGAHSCLAYLGALSGIEFVHEAAAHPAFRRLIEQLWDEAQTTLKHDPQLDVPRYRSQLLARFLNTALNHRTRQIADDGSQKLPQRLVISVRERLRHNLPIDALALAIAGWIRWQRGIDDFDRPYAVIDPLAPLTRAIWDASSDDVSAIVGGHLALNQVFTADLADDQRLRTALEAALARLLRDGALKSVESHGDGARC